MELPKFKAATEPKKGDNKQRLSSGGTSAAVLMRSGTNSAKSAFNEQRSQLILRQIEKTDELVCMEGGLETNTNAKVNPYESIV